MDGLLEDSSRILQHQVVFEQVSSKSEPDKHTLPSEYIFFHQKKKYNKTFKTITSVQILNLRIFKSKENILLHLSRIK